MHVATLGAASPKVLVMAATDSSVDVVIWTVLFTLASAFGLMATAKTWIRFILYGVIVLSVGASAIVYGCYRNFLAIRTFDGGRVELIYLWPRPLVLIDPRGATVAVETTINTSDESTVLCDRIIIEEKGTSYVSTTSGAAAQAMDLLLTRGAKKGESRRNW